MDRRLLIRRRPPQLVGGPAHLPDDFRLLSLGLTGALGGGSGLFGRQACRLVEGPDLLLLMPRLLRVDPHCLGELPQRFPALSHFLSDQPGFLGALASGFLNLPLALRGGLVPRFHSALSLRNASA